MSEYCEKAKAKLYQYLDDELDQATAASIRGHLDDCPDCSEPFDFERKLQMAIKKCLSEDLPDGFEARMRMVIRGETA